MKKYWKAEGEMNDNAVVAIAKVTQEPSKGGVVEEVRGRQEEGDISEKFSTIN